MFIFGVCGATEGHRTWYQVPLEQHKQWHGEWEVYHVGFCRLYQTQQQLQKAGPWQCRLAGREHLSDVPGVDFLSPCHSCFTSSTAYYQSLHWHWTPNRLWSKLPLWWCWAFSPMETAQENLHFFWNQGTQANSINILREEILFRTQQHNNVSLQYFCLLQNCYYGADAV